MNDQTQDRLIRTLNAVAEQTTTQGDCGIGCSPTPTEYRRAAGYSPEASIESSLAPPSPCSPQNSLLGLTPVSGVWFGLCV